MSRLARVLLMSDAHWMVVPPEEQKGQIIQGIDWITEAWLFRKWKKKNNMNFRLTLLEAKKHGPFDQLIFLGDLVECIYNERGIVTPDDVAEIRMLKNFVRHILSIRFGGDDHFLPGDHELGYRLPLSVDPRGGISLTSLEAFQQILGPRFDAWRIGNFHFISVSSSLFIQSTDHLDDLGRQKLGSAKDAQEKFLIGYLRSIPSDQKVFLFLHDPDAIEYLNAIPGADKITQIFCGHMHAENSLKSYQRLGKIANSFWGRLIFRSLGLTFNRLKKANRVIEWARGNLHRWELFKKYNLQVVPAPNGMLGKGSGFLVLELYRDGNYEIKKFQS
jgi:hypothetical protein